MDRSAERSGVSARRRVPRGSLIGLALVMGAGSLASAQPQAQERPRPYFDVEGVLHLPPFAVPPSALSSKEAREAAISRGKAAAQAPPRQALPGPVTAEAVLDLRRRADATRKGMAERMRQVLPVAVAEQRMGGVTVDVITPRDGVAPKNRNRVLINTHGGGMILGARWEAQLDSIPIAHTGGFKVVTIDYRMAPEHRYPAASEDVEAVYRELLKTYRPENIGMFGCSAGAWQAASSVAWFQSRGLPRPGALALNGAGASTGTPGDATYLAGGFFAEVPSYPPKKDNFLAKLADLYWGGVDMGSAHISPAHHLDVLARFPPTLVLNSTRDPTMSAAVYTHRQLVNAGAKAQLHIWEGVDHCFTYDPALPESKEAYRVTSQFFDAHLGSRAR